MFRRHLVISICILLFIGLSINQVNGETVNKRHSIDLKAAYWDNAKSEASVKSNGYTVEADTGGLSGKIAYNYHFSDEFALNVSAGVLQSKAKVTGLSIESSTIIPVLLGVKYYLIKFSAESPVKPYLLGAPGILIGTESSVAQISINAHTETTFMIYVGAGVDFILGSLVKLTADAGYDLMTDFSESIAGRKNYSGLEFSIGLGFMF